MFLDLPCGSVTEFNDADLPFIKGKPWYAKRDSPKSVCVVYTAYAAGLPRKNVLMHRLIMGAVPGQVVDHIDGNRLNNRRDNLRFATPRQNTFNKAKLTIGASRFKSVFAARGAWVASIGAGDNKKYLGRFQSEDNAAHAYDAAARMRYGDFACVNFPWASERSAAIPEHIFTDFQRQFAEAALKDEDDTK